jgi:hypothetical protein
MLAVCKHTANINARKPIVYIGISVWTTKSLSSVVSANRVVAGGWKEGSVIVQFDRLFFFGFLKLEDGTDRLSRNVGKKLPLLFA